VIALLIHPSFTPLTALIGKIRNEPHLIIYILYGILPFVPIILFDEVYHFFVIPFIVIITSLEILGIAIYLKSKRKSVKYSALTLAIIIVILISRFASNYYWANFIQ